MTSTKVITIDARGFACPIPVVKTREALAALATGYTLEVLVDEAVAKENVSRYLRSHQLVPQVGDCIDGWRIKVVK